MGKRSALDTRIAIMDAFDHGILSGETSVDEIANAVGGNRKVIGRTLILIGFTKVSDRKVLTEQIPTRWAPPRKWPKLKRHSSHTRAIIELYESGRWSGRCYARDLAPLLGITDKTVAHALKRLKFTIAKKFYSKAVGHAPAVWRPPLEWPKQLLKQRELRNDGLSSYSTVSATDMLVEEAASMVDDAKLRLFVNEVPVFKRGALKAQLRSVIVDLFEKATKDLVARQELAVWLGESPDANVQFLQTRVEGYVRFASGRTCLKCGHNPARTRDKQAIGS